VSAGKRGHPAGRKGEEQGVRRGRQADDAGADTFTWDVAAGLPAVLDDGTQYVYGHALVSDATARGTFYRPDMTPVPGAAAPKAIIVRAIERGRAL
jgi:hypothetical protein